MRHALLQGVDRLGLALGGRLDERPDLVGEEIGIAAAHDGLRRRPPSCRSSLPNRPPPLFCSMSAAVDASCGMVCVWMCCAPAERAQIGDELLFVARRQERREQDDVRDPGRQRRDGRVPRIDEDEIRADQFANDALEDGGLAVVRLDREHERQGLRPYHEEKEHGADRRENHDHAIVDALSIGCVDTIAPPRSSARLSQDADAVAGLRQLARTCRARAGRARQRPPRRARKPCSRQQHLAKFHGVILGRRHSQCVCRRQICTRAWR